MDAATPFWLRNWLERHRHPVSRGLHYIGIPLTVAAVVVAIVQLVQGGLNGRPPLLLVAGYVLQYIGHRIEGNDMGEVVLIKKLLGQPYCSVAPRYLDSSLTNDSMRPTSATRPEPPPADGSPAPPVAARDARES